MIDFFSLLKWQGFPVKDAFAIWEQIESQQDIHVWQHNKCWEMVQYHYSHNGGYAECVGNLPSQWSDIPLMNKEVMRQHGMDDEKWLDASLKYYKASTSGSSGKPFRFAKDYLAHALTWVHVAHCYGMMGVSLNDLQARFYGAPSTSYAKYFE